MFSKNNMAARRCVPGMWGVILANYHEGNDESDTETINLLLAVIAKAEKVSRIVGFSEDVVPLYTNESFRRKFRLSRPTCCVILSYLREYEELKVEGHGGKEPIDVNKQLQVTLWYLGGQDSIDRIADRFGIGEGSVIRCRDRVINAVLNHMFKKIIKWPESGIERRNVADAFADRNGFPGIIGAIDGTHIKIKQPNQHPQDYSNRKGFYSLNLQAVCRSDLFLTHVQCGFPGSCHDARVYRNSTVSTNSADLCGSYHLIGDSAYPLSKNLLTPYRDNGHLTREQKKYNQYLSSNRMAIERVFRLLKGRFRRLHNVETLHVQTSVKLIVACCVFHNICVMNNDDLEDVLQDESMDDETGRNSAAIDDNEECDDDDDDGHAAGVQKRAQITNQLL